MTVSETLETRGHLMDTGVLASVLDDVLSYGGDYRIDRLDVGRAHEDESYARIVVSHDDDESLQRLLMRLQTHGVNQVDPGEALLREVDRDGVFPEDFYSTTNLETVVRLGTQWVPVEQPEMDCGLVVEEGRVRTVPVSDVRAGQRVVCGAGGVKVVLPQRDHSTEEFGFMNSAVSSEKPQGLLVRQIAQQMREVKAEGGKVLWVGGPGIVHTGAAPAMVRLVEGGYVDVLFAGNALATHDIESALYGTSLGVDLAHGKGVEHGHEHHIRAINTVRRAGSIRGAVESGVLTGGIMHAMVRHGQRVRAGRVGPRRRPAPRRLHRRHRGPAGDARPAARRRVRDHGGDDAAQHRDREHPPGERPAGVRRHQPGDGDQAGRPGQFAGRRDRHRHRPVPRAAGPGARAGG